MKRTTKAIFIFLGIMLVCAIVAVYFVVGHALQLAALAEM